jgi:hypothetical protein
MRRICTGARLALCFATLALACAPALGQVTAVHTLEACCGFGWAVADLADIDGDNRTDLVAGANESGQVYVYSGRTGASLHTFTLAQSDLGWSVADAGDVDGDGTRDIVAGAPTFENRGAIRVFSGRTGAVLLAMSGPVPAGRFGEAVAGAGDLNGDGRGDLFVGARGDTGRAYAVSGTGTGSILYTLAQQPVSGFGAGIARVRDLNGDGRDDVIVGAPGDGVGRAYVYSGIDGAPLFNVAGDAGGADFGSFFVADAGDVNRDGTTDLYVGDFSAGSGNGAAYVFSGAGGARLHKFTGTAREGVGPGRGARDVDGDGSADLAVGSYTYGGAGVTNGGRVTVYSGRTGAVLATYNGSLTGGAFGFDVVGVGDLNGDNRLDLLVSSQPLGRVQVIAGTVTNAAPPAFEINAGVAGGWFNPATGGQGFLIDIRASDRFVFVAWFTYQQAATKVGAPDQRWLSLQGNYSGDRAQMPIFQTAGGAFDNARAPQTTQVGTATLRFTDCSHATLDYALPADQLTGSIPLQRLIPGTQAACEAAAAR